MSEIITFKESLNTKTLIVSSNYDIDISIIVPTYNEADNIPILVEEISKNLDGKYSYEIIIVDDNSPDGTANIALSLSNRYPIRVIVRDRKMGLSSAVITGFNYARGRYLVLIDADLQHPPDKILDMAKLLDEGYDVVIGSRYVKGGSDEGLKGFRRLVSLSARILAWILIPESRRVRDVMSGFFSIKREYAPKSTKLKGYKIILQILKQCRICRICEIPIKFRRRIYGESKLKIREILNYVRDLLILSEYFTIKYIAIALAIAPILEILNPILGILTILLGIVIRWIILRKYVGIGAISISEILSTYCKITLRTLIGMIPAWFIASGLELILVHVLRGWNKLF